MISYEDGFNGDLEEGGRKIGRVVLEQEAVGYACPGDEVGGALWLVLEEGDAAEVDDVDECGVDEEAGGFGVEDGGLRFDGLDEGVEVVLFC